jgi:hypothetical protein
MGHQPSPAQLHHVTDIGLPVRGRPSRSTQRISVRQANNLHEAVQFAKSIGIPLVAHLTIHWSLTDIGDDPNGDLFAKVREGLCKWLLRHDIEFAGAWTRERQAGGQSDVEHCHLLVYLPAKFRSGAKLLQVEAAIARLVRLHAGNITHEKAVDLRVHDDPDGKYLLKGGGPKVWERFGLRREHRRLQGSIQGKRCGVTENLGQKARARHSLLREGVT